jgi:hypothetical protein
LNPAVKEKACLADKLLFDGALKALKKSGCFEVLDKYQGGTY